MWAAVYGKYGREHLQKEERNSPLPATSLVIRPARVGAGKTEQETRVSPTHGMFPSRGNGNGQGPGPGVSGTGNGLEVIGKRRNAASTGWGHAVCGEAGTALAPPRNRSGVTAGGCHRHHPQRAVGQPHRGRCSGAGAERGPPARMCTAPVAHAGTAGDRDRAVCGRGRGATGAPPPTLGSCS